LPVVSSEGPTGTTDDTGADDLLVELADQLPIGVMERDLDLHPLYWNARWTELAGFPAPHPERPLATVHPDDRAPFPTLREQLLRGEGPCEIMHRLGSASRGWRWVYSRLRLRTHPDGTPRSILVTVEDIDPLVREQQRASELASIVERTNDFVAIVDLDTGLVDYANLACRERFGITESTLPSPSNHFFTQEGLELVRRTVWPALEAGGVWSGTLPCLTADAERLEVEWTTSIDTGSPGRGDRLIAIGRDVTEQRRLERTLTHRASHDGLTGLANREMLLDHAEALRTEQRGAALLFLDLDRFKQINDRYGHEAGDSILREVAARLEQAVRPGDIVARLGGDEFVVLCPGADSTEHGVALAQRLREALATSPFVVGETGHTVTASIGVAVASSADPEMLLREADAAMYRAKDRGRNGIEVYDEKLASRRNARREMASGLRQALGADHLHIAYQPIVDLETREIREVEALVRWDHPELGPIRPERFVSIAEDHGIIEDLGAMVLREACRLAAAWPGPNPAALAVNVSGREIGPALVDRVARAVEMTGIEPGRLVLEITESAVMADPARSGLTLAALRDQGVRLSIDDFGTGFSSLGQLRMLAVDQLKVDRSFVRGVAHDDADAEIVTAIIRLAHALGLETIAEGIENEQQAEALKALGCDLGQGFHLAPPLTAEDLLVRLGS
jgi:diguanylate cyclase (GGDEF)-like protein